MPKKRQKQQPGGVPSKDPVGATVPASVNIDSIQSGGSGNRKYRPVETEEECQSELVHRSEQYRAYLINLGIHKRRREVRKKMNQARREVNQVSNPEKFMDEGAVEEDAYNNY